MKKIKVGMAQILVEGGEPMRNLDRALEAIVEAESYNCDLVILPETLDLGWTHPSTFAEAEEIPGKRSQIICDAARENNIWVCLGLTEKENSKFFNTAILVNRSGEIVIKYRKINVLEEAFGFYEVGNCLSTVETEFGKIGLNICSDNYADSLHLSHALGRMGAQIILSPSSWTVDYSITEDDDPYRDKWTRPYEYITNLYENTIIGVTSVGYLVGGPFEGRKGVGCSLVADRGKIIFESRFNEFCSELNPIEVEISTNNFKGTQIGKMLKSKGYNFDGLANLV